MLNVVFHSTDLIISMLSLLFLNDFTIARIQEARILGKTAKLQLVEY